MHFHEVSLEARDLYASFIESIDEYRSVLWKYCMQLTSNPWDAEDLIQETLMKAFVSLGQIKHPVIPKSYLFRIASNTWIDQHRKGRPVTIHGSLVNDELEGANIDRSLDVLEGIEVLINSLTPRHVVVVLLMEVFDFSAREVAEMLQTTNGAVHAMLSRARAKLKSINSEDGQFESEKESHATENNSPLISRYVEAFHHQDTAMLMDLYAEHAEIHFLNAAIVRGRELIKNTYDWSVYPESYHAEFRWLWGQPVVLTIANRGSLQTLWRAQKLEFEEGQVVIEKNYFFCKEVMLEIGEYSGIPVDTDTQTNYEQTWRALRSCPN